MIHSFWGALLCGDGVVVVLTFVVLVLVVSEVFELCHVSLAADSGIIVVWGN